MYLFMLATHLLPWFHTFGPHAFALHQAGACTVTEYEPTESFLITCTVGH